MSAHPPPPRVGIVIPCFNQARFLPAAVASVRAQTYAPVACVVVDDGSTDETAAVAAGLGVPVLRQRNAGVSAARNAGLAALAVDLIAFLDADDELMPEAIAAGVAALVAGRPDAAAVVGRCQPVDEAGHELPARHRDVDPRRLYTEWLRHNFVWTPGAALFQRAALAGIGGFPRRLGPAADYAVYLRLAREDRVVAVPRVLVRYRQHDASMSRDPARMLRATMAVLRRERRAVAAPGRAAVTDGMAVWRRWYGEQILERLATDLRAHHAGAAQARAALTLLRHAPGLVLRRVAHRTRRLVARRATS
jgi:glycosyltransferase involved in cell wall biosynthesis